MEPSQSIATYVQSLDFIDCKPGLIISIVEVSLPCYFSSCEYILLYRLILETRSLLLLLQSMKVARYLEKTWEFALGARGSCLIPSYPSELLLHTHLHKPFQVLHSLLKLSERYPHHLCFLWRSAEGQHSKEKVLLCVNLMDRLTEVGDRKDTGFSKIIWVLRVTTEFILTTDLKEIYPVEF